MALGPTIYKFTISLSDTNRHYYDTLALTVARHPSETLERTMVRVIAYCLNASAQLEFTSGLSTPDVPDILEKSLDGILLTWIDVGEPTIARIKTASRQAPVTRIYSFNTKSAIWWRQVQGQASKFEVEVFRFNWPEITRLVQLIQRSTNMSVTISDESAYVAAESGECEVSWSRLQ